MYTVARECVEENGERGHQRLTFTRGHFRNLSLRQHHAAEQLHIVVDHVPLQVVAAGHPMVLVDSLVAFDMYKVVRCGQFAVEVGSRHFEEIVFGQASSRFLHDGESVGQCVRQRFLHAVEHLRVEFVNLVENHLAVLDGRFFDFGFQRLDFLFQVVGRMLYGVLQLLRFGAERIVVQSLDSRFGRFDFFHPRLYQLHVAGRFVTE